MDHHDAFFDKIQSLTGFSKEAILKHVQPHLHLRHSELRSFLMESLHLSYGYANTLTHLLLKSDGESLYHEANMDDVIHSFYEGKKAHLLPLHEMIMKKVQSLDNVEVVLKKGYVSLKHRRQFAMLGPKSATRLELGLNIKEEIHHPKLLAQPKGSMCQYIVHITSADDVNQQVFEWITLAYQHNN